MENNILDQLIEIMIRVKKCDKALINLKIMNENSVWQEGFKHVSNAENEYEGWRNYMQKKIQETIDLIEK